jgi:aprataxin
VVIHDLYPKSSVHILLLPRDSSKYLQHPFDAFEDSVFLSLVRNKVKELVPLAAAELRRKYSRFSAREAARNAALESDDPPEDLPHGRDWASEIVNGVHAHPSMTHLHIHILSKDRVSECMRHKKHYNSFATPFLVPIEDFPLAKHDPRRHPDKEGYLNSDLKCWRCSKNFGKKFKDLKAHLDSELESWKRS